MKILILGATGATGRLLARQLLERGHEVTAVVRSLSSLPEDILDHRNMTIIEASLLDLDDAELARLVAGVDAVASCLGHNLTFKGMFGEPRALVTDAARRICAAIRANAPSRPVKYVLMGSSGVRNRDLDEPISLAQKCVIGLLRALLPPHADNENAADFLRTKISRDDPAIAWTAVRPDGLVDAAEVTAYDLHPSPIRSAIFDAGQVSRINVAHFMADLITEEAVWDRWRGQMPVIYNRSGDA